MGDLAIFFGSFTETFLGDDDGERAGDPDSEAAGELLFFAGVTFFMARVVVFLVPTLLLRRLA